MFWNCVRWYHQNQGCFNNLNTTLTQQKKADKDDLSETVNRVELDGELEKFATCIQALSDKLYDEEVKRKAGQAVDESVLETMCKKDDVKIINNTRILI